MTRTPTADRYVKTIIVNGVPQPEDSETVDAAYVERYTSPETLRWFRNLGGTETVSHLSDGRIRVKSVSPDGDIVKQVTFWPVTRMA